jgi:hypothetical protein
LLAVTLTSKVPVVAGVQLMTAPASVMPWGAVVRLKAGAGTPVAARAYRYGALTAAVSGGIDVNAGAAALVLRAVTVTVRLGT